MKVKLKALGAFLLITSVVVFFYVSRISKDVEGTNTVTETNSALPENMSIRDIQTTSEKEEIKNTLLTIGDLLELKTVEWQDATFDWQTNANTNKLLGNGLKAKKISSTLVNNLPDYLETQGFILNEENTLVGNTTNTRGYIKNRIVCLIKNMPNLEHSNTQDFEIRCGVLDKP